MTMTTANGSASLGLVAVGLCLQLDTNVGFEDIDDGDDGHG